MESTCCRAGFAVDAVSLSTVSGAGLSASSLRRVLLESARLGSL